MARSKTQGRRPGTPPATPRELGLRAFQHGRLSDAIAIWEPLAPRDPAVARALAEALLRRALALGADDPLADLRRAAALAPNDMRVQLQIGRLMHRAGQHAAADAAYAAVLAREPGNQSAARLRALLALEQRPTTDLAALPWVTAQLRAWAAPAQSLLRGQIPPPESSPLGTFWHGLGQLAAGKPEAAATLADERSLPAEALHPLRRYLHGIAAARAGDNQAALRLWQSAYEAGHRPPGLEANLGALLLERLQTLVDAGEVAAAGELARQWALLSAGAAFDELRLQALHAAAAEAAAAGDWKRAIQLWDAARQIVAGAPSLGSPRPILHNLALAYERSEDWETAADAWRAMLRTRAKRRPAEADPQEDRRWAWVRARIIDCYKHAGRPDEAVTVFRQAIKQDPNDLDLRLQLADALEANDQERAAHNEIKRILEIDPHHPEAVSRHALHLVERWQIPEAQRLARNLAAHYPEREDVQRRVADMFMAFGRAYSQFGDARAAFDNFVEGERYDPTNPRFPLNQARMAQDARRKVDSAALIERALAAGVEQTETWVLAIETWAMLGQFEQARALVERFERERAPTSDDYLAVGMQLMTSAIRQQMPSFIGVFAAPKQPQDTPAIRLASELIEKAVAARPDDTNLLKQIISTLMVARPDLARPFAARLVALLPDDADALIFMGLVQGLAGHDREGKATLKRAAQLATRAGQRDLADQANALRQAVGTPMLRLMLSAGLSGAFDDDLDELDELEDLFS